MTTNKAEHEREELKKRLGELAKPYKVIKEPSEEQMALGGTFTVDSGTNSLQLAIIANIEALADFIAKEVAAAEQQRYARYTWLFLILGAIGMLITALGLSL